MATHGERDQLRASDLRRGVAHRVRAGTRNALRSTPATVLPHVSPEWVRSRLDNVELRLVDVRRAVERSSGYLPGAVRLDPGQAGLPAPAGPRVPIEEFAWLMSSHGIGDDHLVVAYDEMQGHEAPALVLELLRVGHARAAVLAGGFWAWSRANLPVTLAPIHPEPAPFTARCSILGAPESHSRIRRTYLHHRSDRVG